MKGENGLISFLRCTNLMICQAIWMIFIDQKKEKMLNKNKERIKNQKKTKQKEERKLMLKNLLMIMCLSDQLKQLLIFKKVFKHTLIRGELEIAQIYKQISLIVILHEKN